MQEQFLVAKSPGPLNVVRLRGGLLHPRWPLLSGLLTSMLVYASATIRQLVACPSSNSGIPGVVCALSAWSAFAQIALITALFFCGWVMVFVLGYVAIEAPERPAGHLKLFLRSISDVALARRFFMPYGVLALSGIGASIVMELLRSARIPAVPFALAFIVLVTVTWTQVHHVLRERRVLEAQELDPATNAMVSPWYLLRCLPLIRSIARRLRNDQVYPATMLADMQPSHPAHSIADEIQH